MVKDALGNEIVIGQNYGYSRSQNGNNTIHIGTVTKITPTEKVTLNVLYTREGLYGDADFVEIPKGNVSVKPVNIFPVDITMIQVD